MVVVSTIILIKGDITGFLRGKRIGFPLNCNKQEMPLLAKRGANSVDKNSREVVEVGIIHSRLARAGLRI